MPEYLDFLNKNVYRNYPFQGSCSLTAQNGKVLADNTIIDASITTTSSYPRVVAQQVYVRSGYVAISFGDFTSGTHLGVAQGSIVSDYTTLAIVAATGVAFGGSVTVGFLENLAQAVGTYVFNPTDAEFEGSVISVVPAPGVRSLTVNDVTTDGVVTLGKLTNVTGTLQGNAILLSTVNTTGIASVNDLDSSFRNCPTPVITSINGAIPYSNPSSALDGNIFLLGVAPVVFNASIPTGSIVTSTTGLTMSSLCTATGAVLPPLAPTYLVSRPAEIPAFDGSERYFTKSQTPVLNMFSATEAEFMSWPQFTPTVSATYASVGSGTKNTLIPPFTYSNNQQIVKILVTATGGTINYSFGVTKDYVDDIYLTGISVSTVPVLSVVASTAPLYDHGRQLFLRADSITGTPVVSVIVWLRDPTIN